MITRKEYHSNKQNESLNSEHTNASYSDNLERRSQNVNYYEVKSKRLAKRLNWTIVVLILLIIVVYLILIYVNP